MRTRSPLIGIVLGLLLLAGVVAFTLVLQGREDSDDEAASLPADPFPAELAGGKLVTYDQLDPIDGVDASPEELAAAVDEESTFAEERLAEVFEADVAIKVYAAPDLTGQAEVTVVAGEPGFFKPGLPSDPDVRHDGPWFEVAADGDARCFVAWGSDEQTASSGGIPGALQCQRGGDDRTFDIRAAGVTVETAAAALNDVVDHVDAQDQ